MPSSRSSCSGGSVDSTRDSGATTSGMELRPSQRSVTMNRASVRGWSNVASTSTSSGRAPNAEGRVSAHDTVVDRVAQLRGKIPGHIGEPESDIDETCLQSKLTVESCEQRVLRSTRPGAEREQRLGIAVCGKRERDVAHALEDSRDARVAGVGAIEQLCDSQCRVSHLEQPLDDDTVSPLAFELAVTVVDADDPEPATFVQHEACGVLRKDPGDDLPESPLGVRAAEGGQRHSSRSFAP